MTLENLVRIKELHNEPPDKREFEGLLIAARDRLNDAENKGLSYASRFDLAYNAAHGLCLGSIKSRRISFKQTLFGISMSGAYGQFQQRSGAVVFRLS